MPMQHWCDSQHPRQPNNTSGYRRPASSRQGGSAVLRRKSRVPRWWWRLSIVATAPLKKMYASLSSCLLGCPQKRTFSLLAKAQCQFSVLLCIVVNFILALVFGFWHHVFFFFFFPLGFGISCVFLFYLSLPLPCLIHSSCGWLAGLPSLYIMLRILGLIRNMSKACGSLDGRGVCGRRDTCICTAKSLCFPSETTTTWLIRYIPI